MVSLHERLAGEQEFVGGNRRPWPRVQPQPRGHVGKKRPAQGIGEIGHRPPCRRVRHRPGDHQAPRTAPDQLRHLSSSSSHSLPETDLATMPAPAYTDSVESVTSPDEWQLQTLRNRLPPSRRVPHTIRDRMFPSPRSAGSPGPWDNPRRQESGAGRSRDRRRRRRTAARPETSVSGAGTATASPPKRLPRRSANGKRIRSSPTPDRSPPAIFPRGCALIDPCSCRRESVRVFPQRQFSASFSTTVGSEPRRADRWPIRECP